MSCAAQPVFAPLSSDDVHHHGRRIDWGDWAVCRDDYAYMGTGALKTGASYHPAPGDSSQTNLCWHLHCCHTLTLSQLTSDFIEAALKIHLQLCELCMLCT